MALGSQLRVRHMTVRSQGIGIKGEKGSQGPAGNDGTPGKDGVDGARGSIWTSGSGAPAGSANTGDMYLDTITGDVYRWV